jgi:glycosyltransferase involved in cell wall biosynthesis
MKICLIAQVENWRGGIQQYSQNYAEELSQKAEVSIIGYHSYFPLWLYPGEIEQIAEEYRKWKRDVPVFNVLKYYSLLSVYGAFKLITQKIMANIVDIQWCTTFHAPILIPLIFLLKCFSKVNVFLTVHNVLPHEIRFFDKPLCKIIYRMSDRLVVHSGKMKNDLINIFGISSEKISIIAHGICLDYQKVISREEAKNKLGIKEKNVILFFGFIRKYKGLDYLLNAFTQIKDDFDVALLVAGDFVEGKDRYEKIINRYGIQDRVYIRSGYIKDEDVPVLFSASDFLVQPYNHFAGQSGITHTAYNYSIPVIATNVGGLPEIVLNGRTGLIVEPKDSNQLSQAIRTLLQNDKKISKFGENGKIFLEQELSWDSIAEKMINNYSIEMNTYKKKKSLSRHTTL